MNDAKAIQDLTNSVNQQLHMKDEHRMNVTKQLILTSTKIKQSNKKNTSVFPNLAFPQPKHNSRRTESQLLSEYSIWNKSPEELSPQQSRILSKPVDFQQANISHGRYAKVHISSDLHDKHQETIDQDDKLKRLYDLIDTISPRRKPVLDHSDVKLDSRINTQRSRNNKQIQRKESSSVLESIDLSLNDLNGTLKTALFMCFTIFLSC